MIRAGPRITLRRSKRLPILDEKFERGIDFDFTKSYSVLDIVGIEYNEGSEGFTFYIETFKTRTEREFPSVVPIYYHSHPSTVDIPHNYYY